jgi:hypothetical protein
MVTGEDMASQLMKGDIPEQESGGIKWRHIETARRPEK